MIGFTKLVNLLVPVSTFVEIVIFAENLKVDLSTRRFVVVVVIFHNLIIFLIFYKPMNLSLPYGFLLPNKNYNRFIFFLIS